MGAASFSQRETVSSVTPIYLPKAVSDQPRLFREQRILPPVNRVNLRPTQLQHRAPSSRGGACVEPQQLGDEPTRARTSIMGPRRRLGSIGTAGHHVSRRQLHAPSQT